MGENLKAGLGGVTEHVWNISGWVWRVSDVLVVSEHSEVASLLILFWRFELKE